MLGSMDGITRNTAIRAELAKMARTLFLSNVIRSFPLTSLM